MASFEETFKRVEKKYCVTRQQRDMLIAAIEPHMELGEYGKSTVTSLYLDTDDHALICRSLEKPLYKEKLRIRHYGALDQLTDDTPVFVEMKKKYKGVVYKRRLCMSWAAAREFLGGTEYEQACADAPLHDAEKAAKSLSARSIQIAREIEVMCSRYDQLGYSMVVACERTAYQRKPAACKGPSGEEALLDDQAFLPKDGLRITFDDHIRYCEVAKDGQASPSQELLPQGHCIVEIKAAGAFPLWLCRALSRCGIRPTSFSKYGESFKAIRAAQGIA